MNVNNLIKRKGGGKIVKKIFSILLAGVCVFYFLGCGKKQDMAEQTMPEPLSMDKLSSMSLEPTAKSTTSAETKNQETSTAALTVDTTFDPKLEQLPPAGPYKPSVKEIQTALKNAGFYNSQIDGALGPMTKKSIEEFQKANGLTADGKVGLKTWNALSKYLVASTVTTASADVIAVTTNKSKKR